MSAVVTTFIYINIGWSHIFVLIWYIKNGWSGSYTVQVTGNTNYMLEEMAQQSQSTAATQGED